jgi:hypothetical protein
MTDYLSTERSKPPEIVGHSVLMPDRVFTELIPVAEQEKGIEEVVSDAVQRYLWEARECQIDREMEAYRAMHTELKQRYLGQYVAIHNGEVVGNSADRLVLSQMIRQEYGHTAVFITLVEEKPEREFVMHSPRFERGG